MARRINTLIRACMVAILMTTLFAAVPSAQASPTPTPTGLSCALHGNYAKVLDADGNPVVGADVVAVAWPDGGTMADLNVGDEVDFTPVGSTTTNALGAYSISLTETFWEQEVAQGAAWVNVTFVVIKDDFVTMDDRTLPGECAEFDPYDPQGIGEPLVLDHKLTGAEAAATAALQLDVSDIDVDFNCIVAEEYDPTWVVVGQAFNYNTNGATLDFKYEQGSTSSLGTAMTWDLSEGGSFTYGGMAKAESSSSIGFVTLEGTDGGATFQTKFGYGRLECAWHPIRWGKVQPLYHATGDRREPLSPAPVITDPARFCVQSEGAETTIRESRADTISGGVKLGGIIGFDLSSQTGYNEATQIVVKGGNDGTLPYELCGVHAAPGRVSPAPGTLVLRDDRSDPTYPPPGYTHSEELVFVTEPECRESGLQRILNGYISEFLCLENPDNWTDGVRPWELWEKYI